MYCDVRLQYGKMQKLTPMHLLSKIFSKKIKILTSKV